MTLVAKRYRRDRSSVHGGASLTLRRGDGITSRVQAVGSTPTPPLTSLQRPLR